MMEFNAKLGANLFYQLEKLRCEKGSVTAEDAGSIVSGIMQSGNKAILQKEIVQMIKDIENAKQEILSLSAGAQTNAQAISDASEHLDTVIKSTEEATNGFMDAASAVAEVAQRVGGEDGQQLQDISTRIYEACNFQDLTTQRIAKVIKLIRALDGHIQKLSALFEISQDGEPVYSAAILPDDDSALLNGPALPQDAVSQDEIDALFKSLGG